MLSPAAIASSLSNDRTKRNVMHLVEQMQRSGIDIQAYLAEVDLQPLPVKWHMTWTLSHFVEQNPEAGASAQRLIWACLSSCRHEGMQRDLWRSMTFFDIADDISGRVYDRALQVISSARHPIAVRVHAMLVAFHIARSYPTLLAELEMVLEPLKDDDGSGIRSRSQHILKQIARQKRPGR